MVKRASDILISLALLPILIGAACVLFLLNPFYNRGPLFFVQKRMGRDCEPFMAFKFRTMTAATVPTRGAECPLEVDRITRLGDFMRKCRLDELPQILNVLRGDMSLIGPRPIISPTVDGYPGDKAYYHSPEFRYYARCTPGITGLWQVSGRSDTRHEERVRLDRWYARNWTVWLDLMILFKTVRVVMFGKGSA